MIISFHLTPIALLKGRKTVTRRLGWKNLRPGATIEAVLKSQGRRPGEPLVRLAMIEVKDVRREELARITKEDVAAEGFGDRSPAWFVEMFTRNMGCTPDTIITRIEFALRERLPDGEQFLRDYSQGLVEGLANRPCSTLRPGWVLGWGEGTDSPINERARRQKHER